MKVTIAQINYHIGNFSHNIDQMLAAISQAKAEGSDIVCFSELAVCGGYPADFLSFENFIAACDAGIARLNEAAEDIAIVVGSPTAGSNGALHNSALFISEGKVEAVQHKVALDGYDQPYFTAGEGWATITYCGKNLILVLGDAASTIQDNAHFHNRDYTDTVLINLSAATYSCDRESPAVSLSRTAAHYQVPIVHVNQVGAHTDIIYGGGSCVLSASGEVSEKMDCFTAHTRTYDLDALDTPAAASDVDAIQGIHDALILGLKDYFGKLGFSKAIIGLSGGIDSAVTAALAVRALGAENVQGLLMPSQFSSDHSVADAVGLAQNTGMPYDIIEIEDIYDQFLQKLQPIFGDAPFDVTEENLQARIRGVLNMAVSNKKGCILLNTSNKSEMAVGYGTLYGDLCGGLSVLGDVYKSDVFKLAHYINKDQEIIPHNTIVKPPSAELRPDQKDSDSLPDYDVLDKILYLYIEEQQDIAAICSMGYNEALVRRILKLVNRNEFKRHQTAPVLKVSSQAFGTDRSMPVVADYSWL